MQFNSLATALFMQLKGLTSPQTREIIRGWDTHKEAVDTLPSTERDKIKSVAELIVTSISTPGLTPLGLVTIIGHADKDSKGAAFEKKVSDERAQNVTVALTKEIIRVWTDRKLGRFPKGRIAFDPPARGVGSTEPDASNIPVVRNRVLNRRVEIIIRPRGAPVAPPDPIERRIARALKLLETNRVDPDPKGKRTGRARCMLTKLQKPGIVDVFVDGTASGKTIGVASPKRPNPFVPGNLCSFPGNYDPPPLAPTELTKFLGTVSAILKGPGFAAAVSDQQILQGLSGLTEMISEGIVRVEEYITRNTADTYTGDHTRGFLLSSIFADHLNDESSIYSCYKDLTGRE